LSKESAIEDISGCSKVVEREMRDLLMRLVKAVYRYERELDRLRRPEGVEVGHSTLVERIARKYGESQEEKLFIMETLAEYYGDS
jgi:hypothetical protein